MKILDKQYQVLHRKLFLLANDDDKECSVQIMPSSKDGNLVHTHRHWELRLFGSSEESPFCAINLIPPGMPHQGLLCSSVWNYKISAEGFRTSMLPLDFGLVSVPPQQMQLTLELLEHLKRCQEICGDSNKALMNSFTRPIGQVLLALHEQAIAAHQPEQLSIAIAEDGQENVFVRAARYISANFRNQDFSVEETAQRLGIAENGLGRVFQKHIGMSARQYLIRYRLRFACTILMQHNKMPIYLLAKKTGWNSPQYFAAVFKRIVGISVKEFAEQAQRGKAVLPAILQFTDSTVMDAVL